MALQKHICQSLHKAWRWVVLLEMPCQLGGNKPRCRWMAGEVSQCRFCLCLPFLPIAFSKQGFGPRLMYARLKAKCRPPFFKGPTGEHFSQRNYIVLAIAAINPKRVQF